MMDRTYLPRLRSRRVSTGVLAMETDRLKAFSDGVIAILITILVLELRAPEGHDFASLVALWPVFLAYVLSFTFLAIYWNNHHHLLYACERVNGAVLWANMHLLFWLSLLPFTTAWMDESDFATAPTATHGFVLLMAALAYGFLKRAIIAENGENSVLARALGRDVKGKVSLVAYVAAIGAAFFQPILSQVLFFAVAGLWLVPDRRIERVLREQGFE